MKRFIAGLMAALGLTLLIYARSAQTAPNNEMQIRQLIDRWTKAFEAKDVKGVMAIYGTGDELVAYDLTAPLEYRGKAAYEKDYEAFFAQYRGPLEVEFHDLKIVAGNRVAFSRGIEKVSGTMTNGQKTAVWVRVTECYRKVNGRWFTVHDHVSVPVNFETGKAELELQP